MEKLNEYLQTLLSTCSYELRLEPNKNPYVISSSGPMDVTNTPLLGTQISMMVFPLIPVDVKKALPNSSEVEFVHLHSLGDFSFLVKKSPAGFNVTIRPLLSEAAGVADAGQSEQVTELTPGGVESNSEFGAGYVSEPNERSVLLSENRALDFEQTAAAESDPGILIPEIIPEDSSPAVAVEDISFYASKTESETGNSLEFADAFAATPVKDQTSFGETEKNDSNSAVNFDTSYAETPQNSFVPVAGEVWQPVETVQNSQIPQISQQAEFIQMPIRQQQTPIQSGSAEFVPAPVNPQAKARMDALFYRMAEAGASDLHLSVSMPPMIRQDGKMQKLECSESMLTADVMRELLTSIMPVKSQEDFSWRNDTDFAYEIPNLARFRANIFRDRKGMGGVFRIIPTKILTAEQLGLSKAIMDLCALSKGLVVVTGPTGSGKSTTLCAMVNHINKTRNDHIITIEDPIEFVHENQKCLVNQREVGNHTDSFKNALRAALREDPDILLVGEMRDLETISIAIETAETGHLVFGTLHTTTAASTVDRIIDQFPADRQQQIRVMLSESLKGVIAQTLLPKKGGGRVAALEVLIVTPAISNLIREGKTFQIPSAMQTGKTHGMVMLNDALFDLVQKGMVEPRDAYIKAIDKNGFESLLTRGGFSI